MLAVCGPVAVEGSTPSSLNVLTGGLTEAIRGSPLAGGGVASAPTILTIWLSWNFAMSAAATVTTAGLAFDRLVTVTAAPIGALPPSQLQTPSTPLHITVYLLAERLAKPVQLQSLPAKPDL